MAHPSHSSAAAATERFCFSLPADRPPEECQAIPDTPVWLHLCGGRREMFDEVGARFHLHPLAIEDCFSPRQQPKVEEYPAVTFLVLHGIGVISTSPKGKRRETLPVRELRLNAFIGNGFLITHAPDESAAERLIEEIRSDRFTVPLTPDHVLHRLCDLMVDEAIQLLNVWETTTADLEDRMMEDVTRASLDAVFHFRRHLRRVSKVLMLEREVFYRLSHEPLPGISRDGQFYFRDTYDHTLRLAEAITAHREAISDALEVNLTLIANRTNIVTKQLSIVATLLLPLTVITGFFGMNFIQMPWIHEPWGFVAAAGLMALVIIAMLVFFRRRRWLQES